MNIWRGKSKLTSFIKILFAFFVIPSITSCVWLNSFDYKIDAFCNDIISYTSCNANDNYDYPILSISKKDKTSEYDYYNLMDYYYYNLSVESCRYISDYDASLFLEDINVKILTQMNFGITTIDDLDGHNIIDYNQYITMFPGTILGDNNEYLNSRFGAQCFVYISDTLAIKLANYYNLNDISELITNEKYCLLDFNFKDDLTLSASINNIILTNKRVGIHTKEMYGDFCIMRFQHVPKNILPFSFELDLKQNINVNKNIFSDLIFFGYDNNDFDFKIKYFNKESKNFYDNDALNNSLNFIYNYKYDYLRLIFYILLIFANSFFILFVCRKARSYKNNTSLVLPLLFFIILFFISNFIYVYSKFMIPFIVDFIVLLFANFSDYKNCCLLYLGKLFKNNFGKVNSYEKIDI